MSLHLRIVSSSERTLLFDLFQRSSGQIGDDGFEVHTLIVVGELRRRYWLCSVAVGGRRKESSDGVLLANGMSEVG